MSVPKRMMQKFSLFPGGEIITVQRGTVRSTERRSRGREKRKEGQESFSAVKNMAQREDGGVHSSPGSGNLCEMLEWDMGYVYGPKRKGSWITAR